tara:strand:+ start:332 stop:658 length:327 start_codon:yes stop_codon:yes gene_type:complete
MFKEDKPIGWAIVATLGIFVWACWDPFMNDREQFLRVVGVVIGSAFIFTIIFTAFFRALNQGQQPEDSYNKWLDDNSRSIERKNDQEYSEDNWNSKVKKQNSKKGEKL